MKYLLACSLVVCCCAASFCGEKIARTEFVKAVNDRATSVIEGKYKTSKTADIGERKRLFVSTYVRIAQELPDSMVTRDFLVRYLRSMEMCEANKQGFDSSAISLEQVKKDEHAFFTEALKAVKKGPQPYEEVRKRKALVRHACSFAVNAIERRFQNVQDVWIRKDVPFWDPVRSQVAMLADSPIRKGKFPKDLDERIGDCLMSTQLCTYLRAYVRMTGFYVEKTYGDAYENVFYAARLLEKPLVKDSDAQKRMRGFVDKSLGESVSLGNPIPDVIRLVSACVACGLGEERTPLSLGSRGARKEGWLRVRNWRHIWASPWPSVKRGQGEGEK